MLTPSKVLNTQMSQTQVTSTSVEVSRNPKQHDVITSPVVRDISFNNPMSIESLGDNYASVLNNLSTSLQTSDVKLKSMGEIGKDITTLLNTTESLDPNIINEKPGFLGKLFGKAQDGVSKFIDKQKSVEEVIVKVSTKLLQDRLELINENNNLEKVYNDTANVMKEMEELLQSSNQRYLQLSDELNNFKNSLPVDLTDENVLDIQTKQQFVDRFGQKISRLTSAKALVLRQLPQVRIMQSSNITEIDTIKDVVDTAIPLWKSQIGLYISQLKTRASVQNRKNISETINKTIQKNAELMNQNSIDIANGYSSDIITVETIQTVQDSLINSVKVMKEANEKAKSNRVDSFNKIASMDKDLKLLLKN